MKIGKNKNRINCFFPSLCFIILFVLCGCTEDKKPSKWDNINEEGTFFVYRRQSKIGQETYKITSSNDSVKVSALQGENERGRITGVDAKLYLTTALEPLLYQNTYITPKDTVHNLIIDFNEKEISILESEDETSVPLSENYFPVHSVIPATMEMMLYHYYFQNNKPKKIKTLPRGEVTITFRQKDTVPVGDQKIPLDRYIVTGINWGTRTIWVDESNNLVAVVKANTQIREIVRKEYAEALKFFVNGNVEEQMAVLSKYTEELKGEQIKITALAGGNVVDVINDTILKNQTIIIENGYIKTIGNAFEVEIPEQAKLIDVSGKTLIPGLWDMHAHSNQVQWGPAYLAGGITTIRDLGNEVEFATAFRDAIIYGGIGPQILLGGMTDGPGDRGNGIIRATTPEEAIEVVGMYKKNDYKQIKIYNSIKADILPILTEEAHKNGMTVTGHVPVDVGNAVKAVEMGMDMLNHQTLILSVLFPNEEINLRSNYLTENGVTQEQIDKATDFFLTHHTVLDPTIALYYKRALPEGQIVETLIPRVGDIAYELWEGKRFQKGTDPENSKLRMEELAKAMEIIGHFSKAGISIVAGTDNAVPVFSLYTEIELYHKYGHLTPLEALQTATIIPARVMGMESQTGSIEVGKEADIAILDKNPLEHIENIRTVKGVISDGNYYESTPLFHAVDFKSN